MPQEQLTSADAAIRTAELAGAKDEPKPAYHAKLARDELGEAKKLIEDGKNERAELVLQRAAVDAEYALALIKQSKTQADLEKVQKDLAELRSKR